jgi:hypothetical protein
MLFNAFISPASNPVGKKLAVRMYILISSNWWRAGIAYLICQIAMEWRNLLLNQGVLF